MSKFIIRKMSNGQYWWILKAFNGETLLTSEAYNTKQNCQNGITSSKISVADTNFRRLKSVRNEPYFTQNSNNNQVLGTSEMYSSTYNRDNGIDAVKRYAPNAIIEDLS